MSNRYFIAKWRSAIKKIADAHAMEMEPLVEGIQKKQTKKEKTNSELFNHFSLLYVLYLDIYKDLEVCLENSNNPQKKLLLKDIVMNVLLRILEIKRDLIEFNTDTNAINSDFVNFDTIVQDYKLQYTQFEIMPPRYFASTIDEKTRERDLLVEHFLVQMNKSAPELEKTVFKSPIERTEKDAIDFIMRMERGRQGVQQGLDNKMALLELYRKQQQKKNLGEKKSEDKNETEQAIEVIQRYVRGYKARELIEKIRKDEMLFLNMELDVVNMKKLDNVVGQIERERKLELIEKQKDLESEYYKMKKEILENDGLEIKEKEMEKRRQFILTKFEEKEGKELPANIKDYYKKDEPEDITIKKPDKNKPAPKKPEEAKKKLTEAEKFMKEREEKGPGKSQALKNLQTLIEKFNTDWGNETEFSENKLELEFIAQEVYPEIKKDIEEHVDRLMQVELDNLHLKLGINKKKEPVVKNAPAPKPPKIPGENLVGNKDPKDFIPLLIEANILKKVKENDFEDFWSSDSLVRLTQEKQADGQPDPTLRQIRRTIIEQIVIPLGTGYNIEGTDRTFLFYGPSGSGKSLITRAIVKATNALFLDISPEIVAEAYTDKTAIAKMLYTVFKTAKEFQPAVIFIDEIEHFFPKKNIKGSKTKVGKCSKFKKDLLSQISKHLTPQDRVLVIGCTSRPQFVNVPDVKKVFYKKFYFPFPDYSSRLLIIKNLLQKYNITDDDRFPTNLLAFHTEGYTVLAFEKLFEETLTKARIKRLTVEKLEIEELLQLLSTMPYCSADDYDKFKEFTMTVTGIKERRLKKLEMTTKNPGKPPRKP